MKLTKFLTIENIRQGALISSKKRALELVGKIIAESLNKSCGCEENEGICPIECFGNLFKREKLGSTSLNHGIALPHAKLPSSSTLSLENPIAVFVQLETPIDYEASGNKEVDLIYAVMFPEESCEQYKGCLQQIAQRLSDKTLIKQLRNAESAEEIWQLLEYADNQVIEQD
ncbi:phosphoenolpyruvate-dependent sugar phosphotransferase system, EIIA 2 [Actinobacillus ureae ATCC 25976]|uniref:Phosphoenolpyruvate-dependent sugar phosphotransferase system, EIIA 2 n=1 Tax=Actinobacillus ureae ATCC 25976 TaxID=887324 RepID=E8KGD7_9PAST|nr:PTS sugar transporter subunit IIA [Actinobacillus ureae]EFX92069.1 phosphoenolpyruvate-dependent sugar phosphotransferase system, EIIA 2 [Actinobacillus ureae ATCC 25976]